MIASRSSAAVSLAVSLALGAAACGGNDEARVAIPDVYDLSHDPASSIDEVSADRGAVLAAGQLRNLLESQLAWHGITLVETMRAAQSGDPTLADWIAALATNTDDLVASIGLVYGPVGARAFNQQWAQHTQFLVDYAVAIGDGDRQAADQARRDLATYAADSGAFFDTATDGALPADTVEQLLSTHIEHMYAMIDADADGETLVAFESARNDNAYLLSIAEGISTAIAGQHPTVFPGAVGSPGAVAGSLVTGHTADYVLADLFEADPAEQGRIERELRAVAGSDHAHHVLGGDPLDTTASDIADAARATIDRALEVALNP